MTLFDCEAIPQEWHVKIWWLCTMCDVFERNDPLQAENYFRGFNSLFEDATTQGLARAHNYLFHLRKEDDPVRAKRVLCNHLLVNYTIH